MNLYPKPTSKLISSGQMLTTCVLVHALICLLLVGCFSPRTVAAKDLNKQVNATLKQLPKWIEPPEFEYNPKNLADPFKRFLKLGKEQEQEDESEKSKEQMTPLERVEPSQVKLEGIMWYPDNTEGAIALVKLPNGKGYTLEKNTKIGGNKGRVKQILPNKVIIQQQVTDILGKEKTKTVVLELQKTSGENNE